MSLVNQNSSLKRIIKSLNISYPTIRLLESNNIVKISDLMSLKDDSWIRFSKLNWRIHRNEMIEITKLIDKVNCLKWNSLSSGGNGRKNEKMKNKKSSIILDDKNEKWNIYSTKNNKHNHFYKNSIHIEINKELQPDYSDETNTFLYFEIKRDKKHNLPTKRRVWAWKNEINQYLKKIYLQQIKFDILDFFNVVIESMDIPAIHDILRNRLWIIWSNPQKKTFEKISYRHYITHERVRQQEKAVKDNLVDVFSEFATKELGIKYLRELLLQYSVWDYGQIEFLSQNDEIINWNWLAYIHRIMLNNLWYSYYLSEDNLICNKIIFVKEWITDKSVVEYMIENMKIIHSDKERLLYSKNNLIKCIMWECFPLYFENPVYEFIINKFLINVFNTIEDSWIFKITTNFENPTVIEIVTKFIKKEWPQSFKKIINYILKYNAVDIDYVICEISKNFDNKLKFKNNLVSLNKRNEKYEFPNINEIKKLCLPSNISDNADTFLTDIDEALLSYWFDYREIKIYHEILNGTNDLYLIALNLWPINDLEKICESIWKLFDINLIKITSQRLKSIDWNIKFLINVKWVEFFYKKYLNMKSELNEIERLNELIDESNKIYNSTKIWKIKSVTWIDNWWYFYNTIDTGITKQLKIIQDKNVKSAINFLNKHQSSKRKQLENQPFTYYMNGRCNFCRNDCDDYDFFEN